MSDGCVTYRVDHAPDIGRWWWSVSRTVDGCRSVVHCGACDTEGEALAAAQAAQERETGEAGVTPAMIPCPNCLPPAGGAGGWVPADGDAGRWKLVRCEMCRGQGKVESHPGETPDDVFRRLDRLLDKGQR